MRLLWILCLMANTAIAQQLFPQAEGEELVTLLKASYKPFGLLDYGAARDSMYSKVYRDDQGYVTCYYTGYSIFLPENTDPSTFLYRGGDDNGITAEHIYPQSKGAGEGNARSDMHSLVPAIWRANEARSNYPFGEVEDTETDRWFVDDSEERNIPHADIDSYSERLNGGWGNLGVFEPREQVKGDVARAVFYFFTMYQSEALAADPDYFEGMRETLLQWHEQDPVDELEKILNERKAVFQRDKLNPFILDCTLASRVYGNGEHADCLPTHTHDSELDTKTAISVFPNPVVDYVTVELPENNNKQTTIFIKDQVGRILMNLEPNTKTNLSQLDSGLYFIELYEASRKTQSLYLVKT